MSSASAVNPLRVAIAAVLKTIPVLADPVLGGHVYHEGEVRRGDPLPRIVLGAAPEFPVGRYGARGHGGSIQIKCWAEDSWAAQELYEAAAALLHEQRLTVEGHTWLRGSVDRITDYAEPDPEITAHCVVGRYTTQTRVNEGA